ncbi:hypothetical protein LSTR_LSTR007084 [Laodelphax striatellus]|uniref:Uncharacterized protein n=1 Tax=Laodelphax striatellus TaxID=195883 RepID=A0A482WFL9_LAOST|nr:hypothetical protein LSTR_LSTR007084 [Laodelphax striatellus]
MTKTVIGRSGPTTANGVSTTPPTPSTENRSGVKRVEHRRKRRYRDKGDKLAVKRFAKMTGLKKMLAVMSEECSSGGGAGGGGGEQCRDVTQDFLTTGRVGRRNALPDILGEHARLSTAELPDQMSCLSVTDDASKNQSTSSSQNNAHMASGSTQPSKS